MRCHAFTSTFDGPATPLISQVIFYIKSLLIFSYAYSSYNSSGPCSKTSSHFGAPAGCFFSRRSMDCLLAGSIPAVSASEKSLKAAFTFRDNIR